MQNLYQTALLNLSNQQFWPYISFSVGLPLHTLEHQIRNYILSAGVFFLSNMMKIIKLIAFSTNTVVAKSMGELEIKAITTCHTIKFQDYIQILQHHANQIISIFSF